MTGGTFEPRPGGAPLPRMLAAQAVMETRLLLLNGEQLLLTIVIPTLVLVLFSSVRVLDVGAGRRVNYVVPGVLAIAVMSTAFTSQAIATGFERRYGVLKRLAMTPLPRWGFIAAKTASVVLVEVVQVVLLVVVGFLLGWTPRGSILDVALLLVLGTAAFSGLGLLMAGTLRAEATLAGANLVFLLLLVGGGVVVPLDKFPAAAAQVLALFPAGALASGLREVIQHGGGIPLGPATVLLAWSVFSIAAAGATFKWE
ncbi:MAG TPA: ABC transporter permease [Candidatus Dormibacteraeota bacterium]|nr:ABC transporter permease [Candidatus Dormibacteraeota bacterium]